MAYTVHAETPVDGHEKAFLEARRDVIEDARRILAPYIKPWALAVYGAADRETGDIVVELESTMPQTLIGLLVDRLQDSLCHPVMCSTRGGVFIARLPMLF